jgi:hypothetical protein
MEAAISRTAARAVRCPACEAEPGEQCTGARGKKREANHRERIEAAAKAQQPDWSHYDAGLST